MLYMRSMEIASFVGDGKVHGSEMLYIWNQFTLIHYLNLGMEDSSLQCINVMASSRRIIQ